MKRKIISVMSIILMISGICIFIFPSVSNIIGTKISNSVAERFDTISENVSDDKDSFEQALKDKKIDDEGYPIDENGNRTADTPIYFKVDLDRLYQDSVNYNNNLKKEQYSLLVDEYSYTNPALDLKDYGIYDNIFGYISAPSIGLKLPIYLGANDSTMSYGAAHLTYTSLPLGGDSTNTVLAGHTGYMGRIFFDNLHQLQLGDKVSVKNFWTTLNYKVIRIEIHKPNDSKDIFISPGKDLLTLITCISDGKGGFNRCYVICERL